MTAPTTRETADHAELARMAEAAAPYWHAANLACGGNPIAVDLVAPFVGAMSPTVCSSLLSEIAALRGEVASLEIRRDFFKHNMTQAERQRDELRKALEFYANPEIYKPHPHGLAFDDRDVSFRAKSVLATQGADQ